MDQIQSVPTPNQSLPAQLPEKGNSNLDEDLLIHGPRDKQEIYKAHEGTIRVSGGTPPWRCGLAAFHQYRKGTRPVEFVFIGGNAGHQAMKSANVCVRAVRTYLDFNVGILPMWCLVEITNQDQTKQLKQGCLLRLVPLNVDILPFVSKLPSVV